jgi:hypothetical protein
MPKPAQSMIKKSFSPIQLPQLSVTGSEFFKDIRSPCRHLNAIIVLCLAIAKET